MRTKSVVAILFLLIFPGLVMPGLAAAGSAFALPDINSPAPVMPNPPPPPAWPAVPRLDAAEAEPDQILALAGEYTVPSVVAMPALPKELLLPDIPRANPSRSPKASQPVAVAPELNLLPEALPRTPPAKPLLPEPDQDPDVIYVVPFLAVMVPQDVQERIFDQFVDSLNQRVAPAPLKFVILKQGLGAADRSWIKARKYVTGEIFGYVEDAGSSSTEMRTQVRLSYFRAHQAEPVLKYEYPTRILFDHDRTTLITERRKFADRISETLVDELLKAVQS